MADKCFLDTDFDSNWYFIPVSKRAEWDKWVNDYSYVKKISVPSYAILIGDDLRHLEIVPDETQFEVMELSNSKYVTFEMVEDSVELKLEFIKVKSTGTVNIEITADDCCNAVRLNKRQFDILMKHLESL